MPEPKDLVNLPTGKPHISFSELNDWSECSFRHKLRYIDKIDLGKASPAPDFGTAAHAACEAFLRTRTMDASIATNMIRKVWQERGHPDTESYVTQAQEILADVPEWMDTTFPGWEFIDAEHMLYEAIVGHKQAFKGFIDGIVKVKDKHGEELVWLLDWKSTSWGWHRYKKSDPKVRTQLVYYKNFWATKSGYDPKRIRCAFVLLKRTAKKGQHCEMLPVSVGDVTSRRSLTVINNMLASVKRGVAIKNRHSCQFCDYFETPHCP